MIYENTRVYYNTTLFTSLINNVIEIKNIGCVWQKNDNETNMKNNFTIFTFKILLLLLYVSHLFYYYNYSAII